LGAHFLHILVCLNSVLMRTVYTWQLTFVLQIRRFSLSRGQNRICIQYFESDTLNKTERNMNLGRRIGACLCSVLPLQKQLETSNTQRKDWNRTQRTRTTYAILEYTFLPLLLEVQFMALGCILLRHWPNCTDYMFSEQTRLRQVLKKHNLLSYSSIRPIFLLILFFHLFRVVQISASRRQKSIPEAGSHELRSVNQQDVYRSTSGK
jgi:hypothetical protein